VNALERVAAVLEEARIAGGWLDEAVAADVLKVLGLDNDGYPVQPPAERPWVEPDTA
jgi:hypothetical protein